MGRGGGCCKIIPYGVNLVALVVTFHLLDYNLFVQLDSHSLETVFELHGYANRGSILKFQNPCQKPSESPTDVLPLSESRYQVGVASL